MRRPRRKAASVTTALATALLLGATAPGPGPGTGMGTGPGPHPDPTTAPAPGDGPSAEGDPAAATALAARLVTRADAHDAYRHLAAFQRIADANGGHRAAGTPGGDASAAYVRDALRDAGYRVTSTPFEFTFAETLAEKLTVTAPGGPARDVDVSLMTYTVSTPEGGLTAPLAALPEEGDSTPGCEPSDYAPHDVRGKVVLIPRGACSFTEKQKAAADAGAVAALISNNTEGPLHGTLGDPSAAAVPTGGVTREDGRALAAAARTTARAEDTADAPHTGETPNPGEAPRTTVTLDLRERREQRTTHNVTAETRGGAPSRTVMLGAHLDSVTEGPGINDNASGSAGLLEVALELARAEHHPAQRVRFAWWSAEEFGLLGSTAYVDALPADRREDIRLYLNFDMIASPNHALFVYDGDDSDGVGAGPGPAGSAQLERQLTGFLDRRGLSHLGTDFNGRSDYGPFIEAGIPSGGAFTGAEGIKTEKVAALFGGEAGKPYDPCYHRACDDLDNISMAAFDANIDVIAHAAGVYAHDLSSLTAPAPATAPAATTATGGGLHPGHAGVER
ncbi:M28 family metallopeptidase [Streptomyces abyssomicinicus]|uniref:M28 family metallopeptidase n=1 Tax=Streptomyces abyssomicinicus TaxID=574929 RepID=UPI001FE39A93|nr:M28 family peptidase [Streptomyces abyssomicinicus]